MLEWIYTKKWPNLPALDAAILLGLHFGSHWRGASEAERSAICYGLAIQHDLV